MACVIGAENILIFVIIHSNVHLGPTHKSLTDIPIGQFHRNNIYEQLLYIPNVKTIRTNANITTGGNYCIVLASFSGLYK